MEVTADILRHLYWVEGLSVARVGQRIGLPEETTRRLMVANGIPRRQRTWACAGANKGTHMSEEQRSQLSARRREMYASGEIKHWNLGRHWPEETRAKISASLLSGRIAAESYYGPDWRVQRTSCLYRDGYRCQGCGSNRRLVVHHWEPYRFSHDNGLDNLVTLCSRCHQEVHATYRREGFVSEAEADMYA